MMEGPEEDRGRMVRFAPGPGSGRALRDAFGRFATGVTVVTALDGDRPIGITANSFASVSLDPPLLLWSPGRFSARFGIFVAAEHFAVHVLGEEQQALATRFARKGFDFAGLDAEPGPGGAPLLPDCLARFACRRVATHEGGDHVIVVGEVLEAAHREGRPLVFSQGAYGRFEGARHRGQD